MTDDKKLVYSGDEFDKLLEEFMEEDEYDSRSFFKQFEHRGATMNVPVPDLKEAIQHGVVYDADDKFDLRMLMTLIHPDDKKLFVDVASHVVERFVGQPAGDLTMQQFQAVLSRRMHQVGF